VEASLAPQLSALREQGYVVLPRFVAQGDLERLQAVARSQLAARTEPVEFEADLHYPGSPPSRDAAGGETVRRLLDAYARDAAFAAFGTAPRVREWMQAYFGEGVLMSRAHHNCLMTKHPRYGSLTGWHRDVRYWSFQREDLVSVWLALGREEAVNGGLWFVPGSHALALDLSQFDDAKFFRADQEGNAALIKTAVSPVLEPGDAVFFHAKTLHAAGRNESTQIKFSLVYTYHALSNAPIAGSRSASKNEVELVEGTPKKGVRE
jgi:phytanoyl-CoA hydroxylase